MEILIVAATPPETALIREKLNLPLPATGELCFADVGERRIGLIHTGIGMVNTAYHLGRAFMGKGPKRAIQVGIAGSFPGGPGLTEVVEVVDECFADLGAESPQGFLDLETLGFENFRAGTGLYFNRIGNPQGRQTGLRACSGITVNTVHGKAEEIARVLEQWRPEVESMEGAAFFQACLLNEIPFLQLRSISNRVEPRNRAAWKIPEAAAAVQQYCLQLLETPDPRPDL